MSIDISSDNMLFKMILTLWSMWVMLMVFWFSQNDWMPLGYDHGAYTHFINLMTKWDSLAEMPIYLQYQFEPLSGPLLFTIAQWPGKEILFGWWYLALFVLLSLSVFLLGKRKNYYTLSSYLGLFLFFFSTLQYTNFWWSFWKQMFATFFLVLLLRYYRKPFLAVILTAACIGLHRLTWFIGIVFLLCLFFSEKKEKSYVKYLLIWIMLGSSTYLGGTFQYQILPYVCMDLADFFLIPGRYGTWLHGWEFWMYLTPLLLFVIAVLMGTRKTTSLKSPYIWTALFVGAMVLLKGIAHTRLGTFLDLFLILILVRSLDVKVISKRILFVFLLIQISAWWFFVSRWHTPTIDSKELEVIQQIARKLPENVTLVTLTGSSMSWLSKYVDTEIYSSSQGVSNEVWSPGDKKMMQTDGGVLCENLARAPGNVFVYTGARENFSSTQESPCLVLIRKWENGSQLFYYPYDSQVR